MESDSDTDGSHISATPPRVPRPPRRLPSSPPPSSATSQRRLQPQPQPQPPRPPTAPAILPSKSCSKTGAVPRRKNSEKSRSRRAESSVHDMPDSLLFPPDHSRLPFAPVKVPSWNNPAASLSSSVMSRKPSLESTMFGEEEVVRGRSVDRAEVGNRKFCKDSYVDDGADEVSVGLARFSQHRVGPSDGISKFHAERVNRDHLVGIGEAQKPAVSSRERSLEDGDVSDGCIVGHRIDEGIVEPHLRQHSVRRSRGSVAKTNPNWISGGPESTMREAPKQLKHYKRSSEGNFVRLNLRTHGKKFTNRNGKRKFQASSRGPRYRRRLSNAKREAAGAGEAEENPSEMECLDPDVLLTAQGRVKFSKDSIEEAVLAARGDPSDENLKKLLNLTYGYDSFREGQLEAIKHILAGESTMLVLPTGAGKSLCYQLPALILPGITIVVSPLVSLMVDQLRQMPPVISSGLLCSSQTVEEASETLDGLRCGRLKVLFVSPERFLDTKFLATFENDLVVSLIVVDEAHCLSEWSHNFRPSYLRLKASLFKVKLQAYSILAMTATATAQTLNQIMYALEIKPSNVIQTLKIRENLELHVTLSGNKLKDLLSLMKSSPLDKVQSIIIYCKFQSETDIVSKYLCDNNISAKSYHSGIPTKNRSRIQELFCLNKLRVVVATVAFGMGLDKSDVGAVIHYSLPESFEEYVQETGRAGRDGRLSCCYLLLDESIYYKLRSLLHSDGVDEYAMNRLLSQIFDDKNLPGKICSLVKESATQKFDMKEEVLLTVLTQLELGEVQYLRLLPQSNVTCALHFHKTSPDLLSHKNILISTILKNAETKQGQYIFDIPTVANCIGMTAIELLNQLQKLKSLGEVTYDTKDPSFCYTFTSAPKDIVSLSTDLTKWLAEVERCKISKLDSMFDAAIFAAKECKRINGCSYSLHTRCMQKRILDYFGKGNHASEPSFPTKGGNSSPFLRADIKVFLQSNLHVKFTPRAVARIMHGISSPAFPSTAWFKSHFWGRYSQVDFPVVMKAATLELMNMTSERGSI